MKYRFIAEDYKTVSEKEGGCCVCYNRKYFSDSYDNDSNRLIILLIQFVPHKSGSSVDGGVFIQLGRQKFNLVGENL